MSDELKLPNWPDCEPPLTVCVTLQGWWAESVATDKIKSECHNYTLTSHHTAEIAKRDRAIRDLALIAKRAVRDSGFYPPKQELELFQKIEAILNEKFLTTPLEKPQ